MAGMDVAVYGTLDEATSHGARRVHGRLMTAEGRMVITPTAPAALDGLRVSSYVATPSAIEHRNWDKVRQTLERSMLKSRP